MKNKVVKRTISEMRAYRERLVTGNFSALMLFGEAYQIVIKQEIVDALARLAEEDKLQKFIWEWLDSKSEVLEYLYQLMIYSDYSFSTEFMDVLQKEVERDREVHAYE